MLNSEKIWKIQKKSKLKSKKIWKIRKKSKLNSEKIWKIQKKSKLKSEKIGKKVRENEMFYIRHVLGKQLSDISRVVQFTFLLYFPNFFTFQLTFLPYF
jgi:hypothetical protein